MKNYYKNPIIEGADPFVLLYEGTYYLYCTSASDGFLVYSSTDMIKWKNMGYCLKKGDVIGEGGFWAPEVIYHNSLFYMVYVADEHLAIATSKSPLGPFVQDKKGWISNKKAIDGHFFKDDDGKVYLYYVRFDEGNVLYACEMNSDMLTINEKNEVFLFRATNDWELKDCSVVEGPFVLKHDGIYYLTYSANHTRSPYYAVGYATSKKPLGPFKKYENNPILSKTDRVNGVGHHSFTTDHDKKQLICVYHRHFIFNEFTPIIVCIDRAEFEKINSKTTLVIYGPTNTTQPGFN